MKRRWREIPGMAGYEASDDGRVRSWWKTNIHSRARCEKPHELSAFPASRGLYLSVRISIRGERRIVTVHRLVAMAFHGPRPFAGAICRHLNGDKHDNRPSNIAWGTVADNSADAKRLGELRPPRGEAHGHAKITAAIVRKIRRARGTQRTIAERFGLSQGHVSDIRSRKFWAHVE